LLELEQQVLYIPAVGCADSLDYESGPSPFTFFQIHMNVKDLHMYVRFKLNKYTHLLNNVKILD